MLLGEPPRTQADLNFALFGIPVRVHPFFWIVGLILGISGSRNSNMREAMLEMAIWIVALFIAILIHELGHAIVMRRFGFSPWITLYGLGGLASHDPTGSYRSRGTGSLGQILISAAGPAAGFLLATVIALSVLVTGHSVVVGLFGFLPFVRVPADDVVGSGTLTDLLNYTLYICVFWGMVNLLPVYPLDGGHIAREIFLKTDPRNGIRRSLIVSMFTAGVVAVVVLIQLQSLLVAILFGYLAYSSYATLQAYSGRGPW